MYTEGMPTQSNVQKTIKPTSPYLLEEIRIVRSRIKDHPLDIKIHVIRLKSDGITGVDVSLFPSIEQRRTYRKEKIGNKRGRQVRDHNRSVSYHFFESRYFASA